MDSTAPTSAPIDSAPQPPKPALLGQSLVEIDALTQRGGFESYRARQLFHWLYQRGIQSFDEANNLPKKYRDWLTENHEVGQPGIACAEGPEDGTRKLLFALRDGRYVESVLMRDKGRVSLCVSSQVGCAVDCKFCLTGRGGFQRQMSAGEIVGQTLAATKMLRPAGKGPNAAEAEILNNMVFMGMGEPLLNLDAVVPALRLLTSPQAVNLAARRITVSTSGIVPGIHKLAEAATGVNLAVSLNASSDETRTAIMPINKKWPLAELLEACRLFPLTERQLVTFEYVLLKDINDSPADAKRLVKLVHGVRSKINLIVFNPHEALEFQPSSDERLQAFRNVLSHAQLVTAVRYSKGRDIQAACGQLAGHVEKFRTAALNQAPTS